MSGFFFNEYPYTDFHEMNLSWVVAQMKKVIDLVKEMDGWIEKHQTEYEELKKLYDDILAGNFPPEMVKSLYEWTIKNTESIIAEAIKMVFFGLENGYFVAYIPDSWSDITFGTTNLDDFVAGYGFGHLTLTY